MDDHSRRTFVRTTGLAGAALALGTGSAAGYEAGLIDSALETTGDRTQEAILVVDPDAAVGSALSALGLAFHAYEVLPLFSLTLPASLVEDVARVDGVEYVAANRDLEYFNADVRGVTGVDSVRADTGYDGRGVHVAVVDSGVAATHPDIANVANNYQWAGNPVGSPTLWVPADGLDTDEIGHGTHCAGTIAGQGETDGGMAPGATLTGYSTGAAVSVLKSTAAYDHLLANHVDDVDIVSNSYGAASADDFDPSLPQNVATETAYERGLLSVFAMGNSGPGPDTMNDYAKAPWVLSVAATDDAKAITGFSSRGRPGGAHDRQTALSNGTGVYRPGVAAPGNQVRSTMSPGDVLQATAADTDLFYASISGTSMSTPAVSGVAALMYEAAGGDADPLDVLLTIEATAQNDSDYDAFNAGAGFVDAVAAVERAAAADWADFGEVSLN
jgi:serine protease AprX